MQSHYQKEVGLDTASKQNVLQQAEEQNVKFIRLWFTDILGTLKSFAITIDELEDALDGGMGFDGSSITGYQDIEESDMIDRKSTRLNSQSRQYLVCRLLLEKIK